MDKKQQILHYYRHIRDASHIYSGCKDLNEYLQKPITTRFAYVVVGSPEGIRVLP